MLYSYNYSYSLSDKYVMLNLNLSHGFIFNFSKFVGKRKKASDSKSLQENNENFQFDDLEESIKRLRLRPIIFSITSFVEQNVDMISYNLTDTDPEEPDVVVVLPLPHPTTTHDC